jgi:curved DNA-binding protein CbpA
MGSRKAADFAVIERVLTAPDFYAVFDLPRDCSADDVKRSYRMLAQVLHPDHCRDPRATEAFQRLSEANRTLSDTTARRDYDRELDGPPEPDDPVQPSQNGDQNAHHRQNRNHGTSEDVDPEVMIKELVRQCTEGFARTKWGQQYMREQAYSPRIRKPLVVGLLSLVAFFFACKWFIPSQTNWNDVINFESGLDETEFQMFRAPAFNKEFGVLKSWLKTQKPSEQFYANVKKKADHLWGERLREDCHERKNMWACGELRRSSVM